MRAAAERVINLQAERGDEDSLVRLAGEASAAGISAKDRSGLRAFALSEVARLRIEKGQYDKAVEAIDMALREQLGRHDQDLARILVLNRVAALRLAALKHAKAGTYADAEKYLARIEGLPELTTDQRAQLSSDRLRIIHLVGNQRIDALDYPGAAIIYREGVRRFPSDEISRHNLLAVLERLATPLVNEARCADARPFLEEIRLVSPQSSFARQASLRCLVERARRSLDANDPAEAVSLLSQSIKDGHDGSEIRDALAVAHARWVQKLVEAGQCAPAQARARALSKLKHPRWTRARVRTLLGSCAS